MMKRKLIALTTAAILCLAVCAGCGNEKDNSSAASGSAATQATADEPTGNALSTTAPVEATKDAKDASQPATKKSSCTASGQSQGSGSEGSKTPQSSQQSTDAKQPQQSQQSQSSKAQPKQSSTPEVQDFTLDEYELPFIPA